MSGLNGRSVLVALDKERHLRYTFNALCRLQDTTGRSLDALLAPESIGFVEIRAILWAGLLEEDATLGLVQVGDAVQGFLEAGGTIAGLIEKMLDALRMSGLQGEGQAPKAPLASEISSTPPSAAPTDSSVSAPAPSTP